MDLLIGFGNPIREDDGIGPAVARAVESRGLEGLEVDVDYQLTVEHAADAARVDVAIFVDASVDGREPFSFTRIEAVDIESFSSHSVSPGGVLGLSRKLFQVQPAGFLLAVRGYSFSMFTEAMTPKAQENVREAVDFLVSVIETGDYASRMTER